MTEEIRIWPFNGYAPGNYMNGCAICKKSMINVDKLCFVCLSCAVVGVKKELAEKDKLILGYENQVIMASSIIEEKDRIIAEQKLALNEAEKKIKQLDTKPY